MIRPTLALCLSLALVGAPALAQDAAPPPSPAPTVSGVTVSPKAATIDPKQKCVDAVCIQTVVQALKARFPREYNKLMQWCMMGEAERMALKNSAWNTLLAGNETLSTDPNAGEKLVCDDRFAKK